MTRHKIKADICHIFLKHQQVTNSDTEVAFISNILRKTTEVTGTGKSLLEALIFASTNPQYDNRLFIELQVQHMKIPSSCCVQKLFLTFRTIFVHNMFSPCSAKRKASDKDLPVPKGNRLNASLSALKKIA